MTVNLCSVPKQTQLGCPNSFYVSARNVLEKRVIFSFFRSFSSLLYFERIVLSFFGKKSKRGCQNRIKSVQKNFFLVKNLKDPQMFLFPVLTAKNIGRKFFGRLVKIVLVLSKKNILRKNSFFEIFVYFFSGFLSDSVLPYGKKN